MENQKTLTIKIPVSVYRELQKAALEDGIEYPKGSGSATNLVREKVINEWLTTRRNKDENKRKEEERKRKEEEEERKRVEEDRGYLKGLYETLVGDGSDVG